MHFPHIRLKPTKKIQVGFDITEATKDIQIPEESKLLASRMQNSKKTSDKFDMDLMITYDDHMVFGFDYFSKGKKVIIPELNPVTIFYSNAVMSHRKLQHTKEILLMESPTISNLKVPTDPQKFGNFFQLASNCLINLQSALESFANRTIPEDFEFINKLGKNFKPNIDHKLNTTIPEIKNNYFKKVNRKDTNIIRRIIDLRNDIIHLKPASEATNTKYKDVYKRLIGFEFTKAIIATRNYINFYEQNLIEECPCGKEFFYEFHETDKEL